MDINNLTEKDITDYVRTYLWGDDINVAYPEAWALPRVRYDHDFSYCGCGCGDVPRNNHYLPGHDQKHYGQLIRRWQDADLAGRVALVHEARSTTTDGVWSKLWDRVGFRLIRGGIAMSDMDSAKWYVVHKASTLVTKVGRWVYPVVLGVEGESFYRSSTPIKDVFQAGHSFDIPVGIESVTSLNDMMQEQQLGVTA